LAADEDGDWMLRLSLELEPSLMGDMIAVSRSLASDLQLAGVPAKLETALAPADSKSGDGIQLAAVTVQSLLAAGVTSAVARIVVAYLQRQGVRRIVLQRGEARIEVTGADAQTQRELLAWLMKPDDE